MRRRRRRAIWLIKKRIRTRPSTPVAGKPVPGSVKVMTGSEKCSTPEYSGEKSELLLVLAHPIFGMRFFKASPQIEQSWHRTVSDMNDRISALIAILSDH